MTQENEKAEEKKIRDIFTLALEIPIYQRPYKWQVRHVQQLLNDLFRHFNDNKIYRIGTIVLHQNKDKFDIVDGQQRLITLSLILKELGFLGEENLFLQQKIKHSISQQNIRQNYEFIQLFFNENLKENKKRSQFKDYILDTCEMVRVILHNLDEAFQFFDSQNSRGKPLEPYDLLKAYHLREMRNEEQDIVHDCIENWEKSALAKESDPSLNKIINQCLFRLRRWHYQESGEQFTTQELETFKGANKEKSYPYMKGLDTQFQINQFLVNGTYFFQYIEYYRQQYAKLFNIENGLLTKFTEIGGVPLNCNLIDFLNSYQHHHRTGDRYLRDLFECVVMAYYDRFGKLYLDKAVNKIFIWIYRLRFLYTRIVFSRVEQEAFSSEGLLVCIERAVNPNTVMQFLNHKITKVEFDNVDNTIKKIFKIGEGENGK